ncbi:hypothetical protein L1987_20990 [Smallanthus sonchifolius]|uniref:Uncharacterized protein n=1 Tax=Smallanthus sonchifolius TaxID=185202 RepID=A0ACB9IUU3_9ASTR|nr:hypothetical protein L1987_20990 [Smallanthus sonchifolius]
MDLTEGFPLHHCFRRRQPLHHQSIRVAVRKGRRRWRGALLGRVCLVFVPVLNRVDSVLDEYKKNGCCPSSGTYDSICPNDTRRNSAFEQSVRKAVAQAVETASKNNYHARIQILISGTENEFVYAQDDCLRTMVVKIARR